MSARLRLTLSYAGFLIVAGVALIAIVFYILQFVPAGTNLTDNGSFVPNRGDLLAVFWPRAWQVLLVLAVVGLAGGWLLAGRMLRPLHKINTVARQVAAGSFDHRVRMRGRKDEFSELADTFDSMLDRLQGSFDEQHRFAANAAHELRTPYAIERSMLDVTLANPASVDLTKLLHRLDETNRRGIEVVEALLALASIDDGRSISRNPVDVTETVAAVLYELKPLAELAGVTVTTFLEECDIDGSQPLVRQLASNLILNGIRHNEAADGWIVVRTNTLVGGTVELTVTNSGAIVPPELLERLTEPFVRGVSRVGTRVAGTGKSLEGSGLGLALVSRVAAVHAATLELSAPESGGLIATVRFPAPGAAGI